MGAPRTRRRSGSPDRRFGAVRPGFVASALGVTRIIGAAGVSMFPFVTPSGLDPPASLTVGDATSSDLMLGVARRAHPGQV